MLYSIILMSFYGVLSLACSRLSVSGEDAKVKGTRKVRAFSIQRARLSRSLEQATLSLSHVTLTVYFLVMFYMTICSVILISTIWRI